MPQIEQPVVDSPPKPQSHRTRTSIGFFDRLLHLSDVVDNTVRFLRALHNAFGTMLFTVTRVIPLVGVLIEGLGYLATPLTLLTRNRRCHGGLCCCRLYISAIGADYGCCRTWSQYRRWFV